MFLDDNFLLDTDTAVELYHAYAEGPPIFDYHCHLPPEAVSENKSYDSITDLWLGGDHYKWRALRAAGVPEQLVTGDGGEWERFEAWARIVPTTIGNPLYQWTHLELRRYFGINDLLDARNARKIYDKCNELVKTDGFRVRRLMERMNVCLVCTTDDPTDDLAHHRTIAADPSFSIPVYPTFRPDRVFRADDTTYWNNWVDRLAERSDIDISSYDELMRAIESRADDFHAVGCRLSDHGIEAPFPVGTVDEARKTFLRARRGDAPSPEQTHRFSGAVLLELGRIYHARGWVMQIHLGAIRNNSRRMLERLGPDTGYDAIADSMIAGNLVAFLDELDGADQLPKTILYNLNPRDNEMLASIVGSFQDGRTPGKMQFGSAWWFNDQRDGMERQMTALANIGLLSRFVGMITDSRSFLSYPRHEYFRRVLCRLLGRWVEDGEIPNDSGLLSRLVGDVCYRNAVDYFGLELTD